MKKILSLIIVVLITLAVKAQTSSGKINPLPEPLNKFIDDNYSGYNINKVYKVVNKDNVISYVTVISNQTNEETLVFEQNGQFLRKDNLSSIKKGGGIMTRVPLKMANKYVSNSDGSLRGAEKKEEEKPIQKKPVPFNRDIRNK